jgi:adenylate kinase family enzyme
MNRIVVLGTSGSGKTTLARELARRLSIPHIELDALYWEPNWTEAPRPLFRARVEQAVQQDRWVLDGNYRSVRDIVWPRADTIVWLDYSMSVVFSRVFVRTMQRCWTRQELWSGNRERFWTQFFTADDSILVWVITSWRKHRRDYPKALREQVRIGTCVIRFARPADAQRWLCTVTRPGMPR